MGLQIPWATKEFQEFIGVEKVKKMWRQRRFLLSIKKGDPWQLILMQLERLSD